VADEKKCGKICNVNIDIVENGYEIRCRYEDKEMSLGQRAGWVPCSPCECKTYVEKTKDAVLKRFKDIL
jgi:hypothetical protein